MSGTTHGDTQDEANREAGGLIRQLRQSAGLSQEDLSFEANIDQSTLSKLERIGPQAVSWQKLFSLADALGCVVEVKLVPKDDR